ncbi:hypothetical protein VKT23_019218 [Stygiomarasmius scandens]|uniref:Uncharacterized protein n=1 Tax=Marasmiellus scandens TaxID=2682957 RepID=A0ABR1ILV9_9AGAR
MNYDCNNALQYNVFKWIFIPWLQAELDSYVDLINTTKRHAQRNKILPHGPPDDIDEHPYLYNALDFRVPINPNADYIKEAEQLYAPPDHPVFDLVPPEFAHWASMYYTQIGQPSITRNNVWNIYEQLLEKFENNVPLIASWHFQGYYDDREEFVNEVQQALQVNVDTIVDDLIPLRYDDEAGYMGGCKRWSWSRN